LVVKSGVKCHELSSDLNTTGFESLTGTDSANMLLGGLGDDVTLNLQQNIKVLNKF